MSDHLPRRKFTLDPHRGETTTETLDVEDIQAFLADNAEYDPELVKVTFEVDDPVTDCSTTN